MGNFSNDLPADFLGLLSVTSQVLLSSRTLRRPGENETEIVESAGVACSVPEERSVESFNDNEGIIRDSVTDNDDDDELY